MTISLRSDAGGASGAIQVNGADKLIVNSDGSLMATVDPATGNRSHALVTMQKFEDEFGSLLAAGGYQKLPNGLIIQWSYVTPSGGSETYSFPIAFPTTAYSVSVAAHTSSAISARVSGFTQSQITIQTFVTTTGALSSVPVTYIAIGI